jgi:GAF domain-containing protein
MQIDGEPTTVAVTDRVTLELDLLQSDTGDGPCVTAMNGASVRIGQLPTDDRFPHFAVGAADRNVLSVLSTRAIDHGTVVGSLNLYSRRAEGFDERAQDAAVVFAAEVAQAVLKSALFGSASSIRDKLQEAHDEPALLSRAEGFLMAVNDCSTAQARDLVRNAANQNGERLIVTAERILSSVLDEPAVSPQRTDTS